MTPESQDATWRYYGPPVEEGQRFLDDITDEQLGQMRELLVAARTLTDRQRSRIREDLGRRPGTPNSPPELT